MQKLKQVLSVDRLPPDWFSVFRSMTKFCCIELDELISALDLDEKNLPRPLCATQDFRALREMHPALLKKNPDSWGIPQGSPISAVFSNVAMIDFDRALCRFSADFGGYYRRYSDDVLLIIDERYEREAERALHDAIALCGSAMQINDEKTERSAFWRDSRGSLTCDRPLTYLGFTFDGLRTFLRGRTLSRYYRRMTYASRHSANAARKAGSEKVYKRKLHRQFTHLGKANFYSYAKKATQKLLDDTPKRQLKLHLQILHRKLKSRGK